jgi:short-subunit dehydrogenase
LADSTILLAGLPDAWQTAFASGFAANNTKVVTVNNGDLGALAEPQNITTAIIGAVHAPAATSLEDALSKLEEAVEQNDFHSINLMTAIAEGMMSRRAGHILLITFDPRALKSPQDAPARGSARGILTYFESLRPAFKQRGVNVGMLLLSTSNPSQWDPAAKADAVVSAAMDCLKQATLQRTMKV